MQLKNSILPLLTGLLVLFFVSCSNDKGAAKVSKVSSTEMAAELADPIIGEETQLLLKDLEENGDYVNSRLFPSLIKATSVFDNPDYSIHVIDIRNSTEYEKGHLPGAINIDFSSIPGYLMNDIKPFEFDRIVIVSDDGQIASYTTSLLRLMGYANVYALRWGMSGWSNDFAEDGWLAGCSSEYQSSLETTINNKALANRMPELNTGFSSGEEIGAKRFEELFNEDPEAVMIDAKLVFEKPGDYFVINYDRRDKYESGHIPGAVRYKPGATLGITDELATLPVEKTLVVYCGTGHNSGFVSAYLRLFGYDARTLKYGNNGFMYEKMLADRATLSWLPFTSVDINDLEVIR